MKRAWSHLPPAPRRNSERSFDCASQSRSSAQDDGAFFNLSQYFAWQEGYGAFTVSASMRESVRQYIGQQEEHHRTRTFREEYVEFLRKSGVEFEEKYVD